MTASKSPECNEHPERLFGERKPLLSSRGSSFQLEGDAEVLLTPDTRKQPEPTFAGLNLLSKNKYTASGRPVRNKHGNSFLPKKYSLVSKLILLACYLAALVWTTCILFGPVVLHFQDKAQWCPVYDPDADDEHLFTTSTDTNRQLKSSGDSRSSRTSAAGDDRLNSEIPIEERDYENPDYDTDPCRYVRLPRLMGLTLEECDYCRRMLTAVLLGGTIGYERRSSDRPAGIRTLGLVSLGACFFTISSISAFKSSTMGWDSSRVTAALPSGVGFLGKWVGRQHARVLVALLASDGGGEQHGSTWLSRVNHRTSRITQTLTVGAALIWKGTVSVDGQDTHQVHGLTTAAGVWLSAAIGVGAGGALYFVSFYSTALILLVLRYGPKLYLQEDDAQDDEDEDDDIDDEKEYDSEPRHSITKDQAPQQFDDSSKSDLQLDELQGGSSLRGSMTMQLRSSTKLKKSGHHKSNPTYHR